MQRRRIQREGFGARPEFLLRRQPRAEDINLSLYQNKVTAFIGPSGCGKSTLLRVLNRMYDLYPNQRATGHVRLDNEDILSPSQDLNLLRAKVGMVFQKPTPFPMTIYENIAFGIRLYEKMPKSELDDRVKRCLERAALWDEVKDKLDANGLSLSGGQQQRLCIARTVAVRPEVILFDEPCSALDPISTAKIEELIDELKTTTRSPSSPTTCSRPRACPISPPSCISASWSSSGKPRASSPPPKTAAPRTTSPAASADERQRKDSSGPKD